MKRPPELVGMYYWISQIILNGKTLDSVKSSIANIATSYKTKFGEPFDFRWNNTAPGVDISSYSFPTAPEPTYNNSPWVFLREGSPSKINDTLESLEFNASLYNGTVQYYYDSNLTALTKYLETFYVADTDTLIRGLNARFAARGGTPFLTSADTGDLQTLYDWFWQIPTSTNPVNGFGRPPDIDSFLYYIGQKYSWGFSMDQIKDFMFGDTRGDSDRPEVQNIKAKGINSVPRATGTVSNTKTTNYLIGTNAPAVTVNNSAKGRPSSTAATITVPSTSGTSTGSTTTNTTGSITASGTNNTGFVQPTATDTNKTITFTAVYDGVGETSWGSPALLYYMGSDGQKYSAYDMTLETERNG